MDSQAQLNLGFHQVSWNAQLTTTDHDQSEDHLDLTHDEKHHFALQVGGSCLMLTKQLHMQIWEIEILSRCPHFVHLELTELQRALVSLEDQMVTVTKQNNNH